MPESYHFESCFQFEKNIAWVAIFSVKRNQVCQGLYHRNTLLIIFVSFLKDMKILTYFDSDTFQLSKYVLQPGSSVNFTSLKDHIPCFKSLFLSSWQREGLSKKVFFFSPELIGETSNRDNGTKSFYLTARPIFLEKKKWLKFGEKERKEY